MRPPRYRFPDEVRTATHAMASRMVRDHSIPATPEELDAWIAERPEVRESLEPGGYGTAFTSDDLFPLLQVFVARAGGPAPGVETPPRPSRGWWILGALLVLIVFLVLVAVSTDALG